MTNTLADVGGGTLSTIRTLNATSIVYVNKFYDGVNATGPTGTSRPLSTWYANLPAAQVDYPYATALTDQVDNCVWDAAIGEVYQRAIDAGYTTVNRSCGKIVYDGIYLINRPIVNYLNASIIESVAYNFIGDGVRNTGESAVGWVSSGHGGTIDVPVFVFDCAAQDEFGQPPAGIIPMPSNERQTVIFNGLKLFGNFGTMTANDITTSEYKAGIRARMCKFAELNGGDAGGTLWDGIVFVGCDQVHVNRFNLSACFRDGITVQSLVVSRTITGVTRGSSTVVTYSGSDVFANGGLVRISGIVGTTQLNGNVYFCANLDTGANTFELQAVYGTNLDSSSYTAYVSGGTAAKTYDTDIKVEFGEWGQVGRCALLVDLTGANLKKVRVDSNSFESFTGSGYFFNHPGYFPLGAMCEMVYIEADGLLDVGTRGEGSSINGVFASVACCGMSNFTIEEASTHKVMLVTKSSATPVTAAGVTYEGTYGRLDITNDRNYNVGTSGDFGTKCSGVTLRKMYNLTYVFGVEDSCLDTTPPSLFEDVGFTFWTIPSITTAYGQIVENWTTSIPVYGQVPPNSILRNVMSNSHNYQSFSSITNTGDYRCLSDQAPTWSAGTFYFATLTGGEVAIPYTFSTTTTNSDPGSGNLRLNAGTQNTATAVYYSAIDKNSVDWTTPINARALFGFFTERIEKASDPTHYLILQGGGFSIPGGWYRNGSAVVIDSSSANPFSNGDSLVLRYYNIGSTLFLATRQLVIPTSFNGFLYNCIVSGISHATTEPTWPTTIGNTVTDGTVTWKCVGTVFASGESQTQEFLRLGKRVRAGSSAPSVGRFSTGDMVWNTAPAAGSVNAGWACTTAGLVGGTAVFKAFGSVAA